LEQYFRLPQDVVGHDPVLLSYWDQMPPKARLRLLESRITVSTLGELKKLNVPVHMETEVTLELVQEQAPDVIVADEISGKQDARALADAARCGVPVVASAHADSFESAALRPSLRAVLESGAMELAVILGKRPGNIEKIVPIEVIERGDGAWRLE